ncbi:MAG TPA: diguanylate cyclase [Terracidiphilus sp.]|jgi:diguanylate cyclase (GGDEF)-like protein|nr:diguanylate cyclase [Terracidiphilus sp.]
MLVSDQPRFLVASASPLLIASLEPALVAAGGQIIVERSASSALDAMIDPLSPSLVFLDADLPGLDPGRTLEKPGSERPRKTFPIVLISDSVQPEWIDQLAEGAIDDVIPRSVKSPLWRLRLDVILRTFRRTRELEQLSAAGVFDSHGDAVTGILDRAALMSLLFRETDRVQRMNTLLCMILFDIDDFGGWNTRLGALACDRILFEVASRAQHLLRSYDLLGRAGKNEILLGLPGCRTEDGVAFARRLRHEVFSRSFHLNGREVRLSGSFAIASSHGRSPVVVLRKAEQALRRASAAGPGSIQCADE